MQTHNPLTPKPIFQPARSSVAWWLYIKEHAGPDPADQPIYLTSFTSPEEEMWAELDIEAGHLNISVATETSGKCFWKSFMVL